LLGLAYGIKVGSYPPAARDGSVRPSEARRSPEPQNVFEDYRTAKARHAAARLEAYASAREDAIETLGIGADLRIADIDAEALAAWERTWARRTHPDGSGGWDWPALLDHRTPRRAAVLPVAIWYGSDLQGLVLGHASRRRAAGVRHTIALTYAERRPEPPHAPLKKRIIPLAISVAQAYGAAVGASRIRLMTPVPNLLGYYRLLGFSVVWGGTKPLYCEKEIRP
jgi:hypothetical protein